MLLCSISGEEAKEPVVSCKSGAVFERKLVEEYVSARGRDPVNDEVMGVEDLVPIKTKISEVVPPKPASFTSIPSLLSTFQNEWDSLALEVFTLRKQLHRAREELSSALYHYDAAVRVAARMTKERDEAKSALQELAISIGKNEVVTKVNINNNNISNNNNNGVEKMAEDGVEQEEIPVDEINLAREELHAIHKSQKPTLPLDADLKVSIEFVREHIKPFKKAVASFVGAQNKLVIESSSTGSTVAHELNNSEIKKGIKITKKGAITAVGELKYHDSITPIIAYKDNLLIGEQKTSFKFVHEMEITQILTHPLLQHLFILISKDGSWSLNNGDKSSPLYQSSTALNITHGALHIDGVLLALGTADSQVKIFDITTGAEAVSLQTKFPTTIKVKFASNGYWLLVASINEDKNASALQVVDLRKNLVVHTVDFETELVDIAIDPSSSLIVSYDSSHTLTVHRYIKKGKTWMDSIHSTHSDVGTRFKTLDIVSTADDDDFISSGKVTMIAVDEASAVLEFTLAYN